MHRKRMEKGPAPRPFPEPDKTRAEREEDAFMELHGGRGARLIYRMVCLTGEAAGAVFPLLRGSGRGRGLARLPHLGAVTMDAERTSSSGLASAGVPLRKHPGDAPATSGG